MDLKKLAAIGLVSASLTLVGCEKKSDAEKATERTADQLEKQGDQLGGQAEKDLNKQADAIREEGKKATDATNAAIKDADTKLDAAKDAAKDSNSGVANTAETYIKQIEDYVKEKKFTEAEGVLKQLEALKTQLPAEWGSRIDGIKTAIETAKKANVTLPGGM